MWDAFYGCILEGNALLKELSSEVWEKFMLTTDWRISRETQKHILRCQYPHLIILLLGNTQECMSGKGLLKVWATLTNHFFQILSVTLNVLPLYKDWISSVLLSALSFKVMGLHCDTLQSGKIKKNTPTHSVKWRSNLLFRATFQTNKQWVIDNSKDRLSSNKSQKSMV